MRSKIGEELAQEIKRIMRKARRFAARNKFSKKAVYRLDLGNHSGNSLI